MKARFCLACGTRLVIVVDEGRRRRRCPRCGWIHYANPVPATAAVVIAAGRLLLCRRGRRPYLHWWDLPGGFLESDEVPDMGLRRELREELGVGTRHASLIGFVNERYGPDGVPVLVAIYRVTPASRRVRAHDDVCEVRWVPLARVPYRRVAFPAVRRMLRRYLRQLSASRSFEETGTNTAGVARRSTEGGVSPPPRGLVTGRKRRERAGSC